MSHFSADIRRISDQFRTYPIGWVFLTDRSDSVNAPQQNFREEDHPQALAILDLRRSAPLR